MGNSELQKTGTVCRVFCSVQALLDNGARRPRRPWEQRSSMNHSTCADQTRYIITCGNSRLAEFAAALCTIALISSGQHETHLSRFTVFAFSCIIPAVAVPQHCVIVSLGSPLACPCLSYTHHPRYLHVDDGRSQFPRKHA